jgi:glutaredoxin 3
MATVRMYTTTYCGYCRMAKRFLKEAKGVDVEEIDVTGDSAARATLTRKTGQSTVPQIFIGDVHVGGYTDLRALDAAGGLDPLLQG